MEGDQRMATEALQSLIQQAAESWRTGDAATFANLFADDGELIVPGQRWLGVTAIKQAAQTFADSHERVKIVIHQMVFERQHAVVEWTWEDTETSTGKTTQADDVIMITFVHGQIQRWREYIDTETPRTKAVQPVLST